MQTGIFSTWFRRCPHGEDHTLPPPSHHARGENCHSTPRTRRTPSTQACLRHIRHAVAALIHPINRRPKQRSLSKDATRPPRGGGAYALGPPAHRAHNASRSQNTHRRSARVHYNLAVPRMHARRPQWHWRAGVLSGIRARAPYGARLRRPSAFAGPCGWTMRVAGRFRARPHGPTGRAPRVGSRSGGPTQRWIMAARRGVRHGGYV